MTAQRVPKRILRRVRGVVAVQVLVALVVLLGFAALTIDVGAMYNVRADLQRAADAAALAGASAYTTDDMMRVRMETGGAETLAQVVGLASSRVTEFSSVNPTFGTSTTWAAPEDITTGWINLNSASDTIHANPQPVDYNAVQVVVRRQAGYGEDSNGPVQLFFAPIFGMLTGETGARAVAVFDDRFAGLTVSEDGAGMLPFTIHEDAFASEWAAGADQYRYDDETGNVTQTPDDIREIRLYPYPLSGCWSSAWRARKNWRSAGARRDSGNQQGSPPRYCNAE